MNSRRFLLVALVGGALAAGFWMRGLLAPPGMQDAGQQMAESDGPCPAGAQPLYWKAPMDPSYVRDGPGQSPMGMDLVPECPPTSGKPEKGTVQIDPTTIQNMGVRTAVVETRNLGRTIRTVGRVAYDERLVAHVHTKVQGWVEKLFADHVGQQVRRGQPLLKLYSPELVATQEELLLAARYRELTQDSPFEDVSKGGASLFHATRRRMELWDVPERTIERLLESGEIQKTLTLYSPTGGVVTKLGVRSGMEVRPNESLYTIADLSTVWVLADIYESELPWVELGQKGSVKLSYVPGAEFSGTVTYIAPFLDPKTRTAQVRLELPNLDGRLKPEMFGEMTLHGTPRPMTAVPNEAVLRSGRRSVVVMALGGGRFKVREVVLGLDSGQGWLEVTEGVSPGDEIVLSGQFLIDSESSLQEAIQKLVGTSSEPLEP